MLVFWIDIMEIILLQYNNFMSWGSNKLNRDVEQGIIHWKFNKSEILSFSTIDFIDTHYILL